MASREQNEYVLGTHDAELERLGLQHRVWSAQAFALWERAGFSPAHTVLDLGCGPGFATIDLARLLPSARIIAIDESPRFVEHLKRRCEIEGVRNVDVRVGDAQALDLPAESIDAVYSRWVLCFLPDPAAAVRGVARVLRPGGVFAVQDYFNWESLSLAPRSEIMARVVVAVGKSWRARGGDPDFVARLPSMMMGAGFDVREITPHLRVARPGTSVWQWPTTFFANFVPMLVEQGFLTPSDLAEFTAEWRRRSDDPTTFFAAPPAFDVIGVKC
ncbi:MAG: class I SAM-dependent methyltransferase [Phycisphaerae bacterium]